MHSEKIQKVLLTKAKLTLDKAVEISQGMEAAAQQLKEPNKGGHRSSPVLTVHTPGKTCGCCGHGNHSKHECKFRNTTCHKCGKGKVGHIALVCRSKTSRKSLKAPTRKTRWVTTADSADSDTASSDCPPDNSTDQEPQPLFVVSAGFSPPYKVKLEVNGRPLEMEVDTVSLAPESAVATLLSTTPLQPSNVVLKAYTRTDSC